MNEARPRISRIAHWTGIVLAAPLFAIGCYLILQYLRGGFGNEVAGKDTAAVIGFVFVSTGAVYLAMRFAGILLVRAIGAIRNIGKGNGTASGSRPSRPE